MNKFISILFCIGLMLWLTGCAFSRADLAWPDPRPLGKDIPSYHPPVKPSRVGFEPLKIEESTGVIKLRQALSLALMKNPGLAAFSWEVRAKEARELQAGLLPNPEIELEVEEIGGTDDRSGFGGAQTTIRLSQLIELGGKRGKRKMVAIFERDLSGWDYETKRLEVFTETTKAFVEVLAAQKRVALSENTLSLASEVFDVVSERVKAGKVSPLQEIKASVALSTSRIKLERSKRQLEAARKRLAATWGSTTPAFNQVEGEFEVISEIPPLEQLLQLVFQNPDMARWEKEIELDQAALRLEKAMRVPSLNAMAGGQHFNDTDDFAFTFGLSIPLQIFDRNQGGILDARYQLAKSIQERRATDVQLKTALSQAYLVLSSSYLEALTLKKDVLPAAQLAFDAAREGYREGKFGYLEVLDSQRTLFEAKGQYIDGLATYHKAMADAERLIGQPLEQIQTTKQVPKEASDEI